MNHINNILKQTRGWFYLAATLITACTLSPAVSTSPTPSITAQDTLTPNTTQALSPAPTLTSLPIQTATPTHTATSDKWKIQECHMAPRIVGLDDNWLWNYIGDIDGLGEVDMLLNFTKDNEIKGFYFDIEQVREYQVVGCVEERTFTMWLHQGDGVEAVIQGEFPETDPRGQYSSSDVLKGDVIIGSIMENANTQGLPIYLKLLMGTAGTVEHRFRLAGVENDAVILDASQKFLTAVAINDRAQIVQMIRFPLEYQKDGKTTLIQSSDSLLAQYDMVFDAGFKARLAKTISDYLIADAGNFIGTIGLSVYGGGGVIFDDHGRVTAISNWQKAAPTPTPTLTPGGT